MKLIYDTLTSTLQAYPRADDEPVIGLDPRYLEMDVLQQPQPEYDPTTHRLEPIEAIDLDARTVSRGWQAVELPPASPPQPDWSRFKAAILSNAAVNAMLAAALTSAPAAATALAPTLLLAEQGQVADFRVAWSAIVTACSVPPEVLAGFAQAAEDCRLPGEFVAALRPELVRARNADGTFIADDPATPQNEAWVPAQ